LENSKKGKLLIMSQYNITTVIATSPIPSMPEFNHLKTTINSLNLVPKLAQSRILVVFDFPKANQEILEYNEYKNNVVKFYKKNSNIKFLHLEEWGHLSGVMEIAVRNIETPFIFVQQHDLPLIREFDLDNVLKCLEKDDLVKHVRLNKRHNIAVGWDRRPLFGAYENPYVNLTRTACWSDQSHLTTSSYYENVILPEIKDKKIFMEEVFHWKMNLPEGKELEAMHKKLGTFIYGSPGDPPVIRHSDARNGFSPV